MGINLLLYEPPLFWFQDFHQILEPGCRDLLSHKIINKVQH